MKKILFLDPVSLIGHVNFNTIYLNALADSGVEIDVVFKEKYINLRAISNIDKIIEIPNIYYSNITGLGIVSRFYTYLQLQYIKRNVDFNNYDLIIMSSYDEISLFFSGINSKLFLINHDNARGFESKIKTFFLKQISKKHSHIVFNNYIKDVFLNQGISNVFVIPHGLPHPMGNLIDKELITQSLNPQISKEKYKRIWFIPSFASNVTKLNSILNDTTFQRYLVDNCILVVVKNRYITTSHENILIVSNYLKDVEYQSIFLLSDVVLIIYPDSFKCRVSAVLFECIANNKLCFISNLQALNVFRDYFCYNPFFESTSDLLVNDELLMIQDQKDLYKDRELLNPDFNELLNSVC